MLSIQGFKSIRKLEPMRLNRLNVLIGPNGAGKSNFVSFFRMLSELVAQRLQLWTRKQGGADRIVSFGVKESAEIVFSIDFARNSYIAALEPTVDDGFVFASEKLFFDGPYYGKKTYTLGSGHAESNLKETMSASGLYMKTKKEVASFCNDAISSWKVFHFHDTSETSGMRRLGSLHDHEFLRHDASNLAAFLFRLRENSPQVYAMIRKTVALAIPFFYDFVLKPRTLSTGEEQIQLLWKQKGSDYALWPSQLSDGSLRFICLVTALLQPDPPSTILIDEPELGLHPCAITLLSSLLRVASERMQVIVSTQSLLLVNEFSLDDLIVVDYVQGETVFHRHNEEQFATWLEEYSVGELWMKNILGGRPRS
ncbi:MAG: AAA family ATPase [Magnetococcales bacterium]|nr:AAA family ATPase [Magnetococcales bacterium]